MMLLLQTGDFFDNRRSLGYPLYWNGSIPQRRRAAGSGT